MKAQASDSARAGLRALSSRQAPDSGAGAANSLKKGLQ